MQKMRTCDVVSRKGWEQGIACLRKMRLEGHGKNLLHIRRENGRFLVERIELPDGYLSVVVTSESRRGKNKLV